MAEDPIVSFSNHNPNKYTGAVISAPGATVNASGRTCRANAVQFSAVVSSKRVRLQKNVCVL